MADAQFLAIDQGTHSTRAIVFDQQGQLLARAQQSVALHAISHDEVEQSATEILQSMQTVVSTVLQERGVTIDRIAAAGLATQRSSVVAWQRTTGTPLAPLLSWQDRRTAERIAALAGHERAVEARTGLHLSPHYGAGKLQWLLEHNTDVRAAHASGELRCGPLASFLAWHQLRDNPAVVDHTNASRTLLWNLQTRDWDPDMLALFDIPAALLPDCRPVCSEYGLLQDHDIPMRAMSGDQTAALYAQGEPPPGTLVANIGTGAFVLLPVDTLSARPAGLLAGLSRSDATHAHYYLEGTVNGAAAAVSRLVKERGIEDIRTYLPGWLARTDNPPLFINTVGGLGAPWWQSGPQPYFTTPPVDDAEAMTAVIESIVFLLQANIALLAGQGTNVETIRIGGGLANLDGLCQRLADLSGYRVQRPQQMEATARGVAWLAAGCPADWPTGGAGESFEPADNPGLQERYERFIGILGNYL